MRSVITLVSLLVLASLAVWAAATMTEAMSAAAAAATTEAATEASPPAGGRAAKSGTLAPLTVAEASDYQRTSSHDEVVSFVEDLIDLGAPVRAETIGKTTEGRSLYVAIAADPPVDAPPAPGARDRLVVFIQGNIHAGEIEGKEASLMLLRDLTLGGASPEVLKRCILVVLPNYNADGNDFFGPSSVHRPGQVGPDIVGRRHNSQNLDLNRDYVKARSTEFPVVLRQVFNRWDPDLFLDLHTTNGSYHGYALTYAPPLHPGTPPGPREFTRDRLLPAVREAMKKRHGYETFDYGNFDRQESPTRWSTYDYRARLGWIYAGVRGRIGILSEAYSYAPYQTRVDATYWFMHEILRYAAANAEAILAMHREHDRTVLDWARNPDRAPEVAIRASLAKRETPERMLIETSSPPPKGKRRRVREGLIYAKELDVWDRFEPEVTVKFPAGYLLPASMTEAIEMLELHGISVRPVTRPFEARGERFTVTKADTVNRRFSGGLQTDIEVTRRADRVRGTTDHVFVPTAQRQGLLAFHLLEPDAGDSLIVWQRAGIEVKAGEELPWVRVLDPQGD